MRSVYPEAGPENDSLTSGCCALNPETRRLCQALRDNAIALRQLRKTGEGLVVGVGVHFGDELDWAHTHGDVAGDPQGASSVKLAFRVEPGTADIDAECDRHASHGDAGTGQQGL